LSSAVTLVLGIPVLSSSSRAARLASAAPWTRRPLASHAWAERECLARAGLADDDRDAVAVLRQPPHHLDLLVSERRTPVEHPLERPWHRDAHSRTAAFERVVDDPPLEREQGRRRVDPLDLGGRDGAAVSPAQHFHTFAPLSFGEHDGVRRADEGVGEALKVGRRDIDA